MSDEILSYGYSCLNYTRDGSKVQGEVQEILVGTHAPVVNIDIPPGTPDWLHQQHDVLPSLDELIAHTCRCKEHVTRQFTQWLGLSPARYLAKLRIDRAAELLGTTNYPVQEICDLAGFNNESYFYRLFSQHKGMAPLAWRRKHGSRSIQTPYRG